MHRRPRPRLRPGSTSGGDCYFGDSAITTRCFPCEDGGQGNVILNRKAVKDPSLKRHKGSYAAVRIWILRRLAPQNDICGELFGGEICGLFAEIARRAAPDVWALLAMTFVIAPSGRVILNCKAVNDPSLKRHKGNYVAV